MAAFPSPGGDGAAVGDGQDASPRVAAIAMLKRAASTREAASPSPRTPSPALSRSASNAASRSRNRSRTISSANPAYTDEDTSLFLSPAPGDGGSSSLERTASLLARQLALAKLTGTAPPTPPPTFFTPDEPMPTLAVLQERARAKLAREGGSPSLQRNNTVATTAGVAATAASVLSGLKRNNTVTGIAEMSGSGGDGGSAVEQQQQARNQEQPLGREQARANLMRKLSARRLEGPSAGGAKDRLGVVGRIGKARPRSGSISALDWRDGGDSTPQLPPPSTVPSLPPSSSLPALAPPISSSSSAHGGLPYLGRSLPPLQTSAAHDGGVGMGISMPSSAATDRSDTPLSVRSSASGGGTDGGGWAAERDRQSVIARASGEGAWEFEEALQHGRKDDGEVEQEVIRDSHLETTPRPSSHDPEHFATPQEEWVGTPQTLHAATLSPSPSRGETPQSSSSEWLAPPAASARPPPPANPTVSSNSAYRTDSNSTSSSSTSSVTPSPYHLPDQNPRRAPFLPSFGIAAVEEPLRKRGSSASSSIAGQLLDMRRSRGSDVMLLSGSASSVSGHPMGRNSIVSATSASGGDEGDEDAEEELRDSVENGQEAARRTERSEEEQLGPKEQRLVDKVEKKREAAQARAMSPDADKGAFPPPSDGYQFPSPRQSQDMRDEGKKGAVEDPQQLFQHLASTGAPPPPVPVVPSSPTRKGRDFPFKLPFQPFPPGVEPSSPRLPDPISPTSVIPDPLLSLSFPPHASPRVGISPAVSTRARFSPTTARNGAGEGGTGMERSSSQQSKASHAMVKSPSTESAMSYRSAAASSYHSPVAMRRDLSSSSRSSDFSFSPRVPQLPAEQLPANRILAKLDSILGPEVIDSDQPSPLDSPPRKLLLHGSVLQVVNANTVKDRHLFLFNDLLVIAKPLVEDHPLTGEPIPPTLDTRFLVKSVVEFKHLKLAAAEDPAEEAGSSSASSNKKRHPLLVAFVDRFANDPSRAIASLVQKGGLANDGPTIANLLFRNTDLNRNQLGAYLANPQNRHVLRAYIERFRFQGVRVDDALRLFCMSMRLPHDIKQAEYVLGVLASTWTESNAATGFDPSLTFNLVMATLKLSDALHGASDQTGGSTFFAQSVPPSVPPSVDDFIGTFRAQDTRLVVPEDLLARIYTSVRRERIEQASDNSIFSMTPDIEATIEPAKLPTRLTYRSPSDVFTITIPEPDPKFTIKLHGNDLQFDPPVLSFARSNTQSFKVTGNALGVRVMVLIKRGANAPRYQGLPLNKAFSIERGFMQHTFQVSFTNHLDVKRKYMFSTTDGPSRAQLLRVLRERIIAALDTRPPADRAIAAAQAVSIQVLRDVFLPPDEPLLSVPTAAPSPRPNLAAPRFGQPVAPVPPRTTGTRVGTPTRPGNQLVRSNSVSKLYAAQFRHEADLGSAIDRRNNSLVAANMLANGRGSIAPISPMPKDDPEALQASTPYIKQGKELVVTTEQNSLLPMLLSFLNTGLEAAPHPLSLQGSAFQLPPLPAVNGQLPPHPLNPFPSSSSPSTAVPSTAL